jgi:hypothetical protein
MRRIDNTSQQEQVMRKFRTAAVAVALATFVLACNDSTDPDDDDDVTYTANLTSGAELHNVTGATATGTATLTLDDDNDLEVKVVVNGNLSSAVTMAHIHGPATASQTAGIILDFVPSMTNVISAQTRTGTVVNTTYDLDALGTSGVLKISADSLIKLLNNGNAYVNVHSATNGSGELRGQIVK